MDHILERALILLPMFSMGQAIIVFNIMENLRLYLELALILEIVPKSSYKQVYKQVPKRVSAVAGVV